MDNNKMKTLLNFASALKKEFSSNTQLGNRRYTTFYINSVIDEKLDEFINKEE